MPGDWGDTLKRTEGIAETSDTAKLWIIVACVAAACPAKVVVPLGPEVWRTERSLRRALLEHEGPIYRKNGSWRVVGMDADRTFMSPVKGWGVLCPGCGSALDQRRRDSEVAHVRKLLKQIPGTGGGRGSS